MTRINLLPWREARREQQKRDFLGMVAAAALVAAAGVVVAHVQFAGIIEHQEARNSYLESEIAALRRIEREIKELDKTRSRLLSRLEIIQNLQRSRPGMVRLFDELVRLLPEDLYLTSLKTQGKAITLAGVAVSNNIVSDLMRRLEESPWFGEPVLQVIENAVVNRIRTSRFELTVNRTEPKAAGEPGAAGGTS